MDYGAPERKGTLFLRSNHMSYNRGTLVSNWHQNREAEPKDYDATMCKPGKIDLHLCTYRRFGTATEDEWDTTTAGHMAQVQLKKDYEMKETHKSLLNQESFEMENFKRDTGCPKSGFGSPLPEHSLEHNKRHLETTYKMHYVPPYPYVTSSTPEQPDHPALYRKCHSQFTDTADYRRRGINTWQDESGIYANSEIKKQLLLINNPILPSVQ
ncbi:protein C9orf135 homolog isoform X2 [Protopterus annectens]|uniref:protein C9orf135 homolog isoform X2 n=1 Tax=Protopterus annectens TaxID=7888 RepID=UPI001CFAEC79|nr:protein C9orf135 homolog isoform X2 [Protopterus annectens]